MKKLLGLGVVALGLALVSIQEASAWSNVKFGVGLNFQWQAANNAVGKHLWRNGPTPGHGYGYGHGYGHGYGYAPYGQFSAPAPTPAEQEAPTVLPNSGVGLQATPVHFQPASYNYAPSYYFPVYGQ